MKQKKGIDVAQPIVMRLSDISSKTGKKCIFGVFLLHLHENQSKVLGYQGWDETLTITLISSQKSPTPNISTPSVKPNYSCYVSATDIVLLLF